MQSAEDSRPRRREGQDERAGPTNLTGRLLFVVKEVLPRSWLVLALLVLFVDYLTGPYVRLVSFYVFPIAIAAWYRGRGLGILVACLMPLGRLLFLIYWDVPWVEMQAVINAADRMLVFTVVAYLVDRVAVQQRALAREVTALRGLLPICSFCKRIRCPDNSWEEIDYFVAEHSEAKFSHGLCPECARKHYGEYFH
jgi:hypothetical protein